MAIYYKGKKVASNRNVNHKDFVDCRDVEFTNPQDGDVPTWDSTAQKLVNRPAHGLFEVWANDSTSTFAGQTKSVVTDMVYDSFEFEYGDASNHTSRGTVTADSGKIALMSYVGVGLDGAIFSWTRTVTSTKTQTGYDFAFSDASKRNRATNGNVTTTTENDEIVPLRIFGIIHND